MKARSHYAGHLTKLVSGRGGEDECELLLKLVRTLDHASGDFQVCVLRLDLIVSRSTQGQDEFFPGHAAHLQRVRTVDLPKRGSSSSFFTVPVIVPSEPCSIPSMKREENHLIWLPSASTMM